MRCLNGDVSLQDWQPSGGQDFCNGCSPLVTAELGLLATLGKLAFVIAIGAIMQRNAANS